MLLKKLSFSICLQYTEKLKAKYVKVLENKVLSTTTPRKILENLTYTTDRNCDSEAIGRWPKFYLSQSK